MRNQHHRRSRLSGARGPIARLPLVRRQQGVPFGELPHGSVLVEVRPDFTHRVAWTTRDFGLHFNTAIYRDGYLYGFDGRNEPDASLACVDAASGKVVWRETPEWTETLIWLSLVK
jgi:hypothetical protein